MTIIETPSPNFNDRKTPIRFVVLHYTGMETGPAALERMCDAQAQVSAHYMVEEDGRLFRLVAEDKRAWHAGVSSWCGETDLNSASIGIEIVNGGHDYGLPAYPDVQLARVVELVREVMDRHGLGADAVIGHSDIAPGRKQDPGEHFPWALFVEAGCAVGPARADGVGDIAGDLARIGYGAADDLRPVIEAFQRRFRPSSITGEADAETCALACGVAAEMSRLRAKK